MSRSEEVSEKKGGSAEGGLGSRQPHCSWAQEDHKAQVGFVGSVLGESCLHFLTGLLGAEWLQPVLSSRGPEEAQPLARLSVPVFLAPVGISDDVPGPRGRCGRWLGFGSQHYGQGAPVM